MSYKENRLNQMAMCEHDWRFKGHTLGKELPIIGGKEIYYCTKCLLHHIEDEVIYTHDLDRLEEGVFEK